VVAFLLDILFFKESDYVDIFSSLLFAVFLVGCDRRDVKEIREIRTKFWSGNPENFFLRPRPRCDDIKMGPRDVAWIDLSQNLVRWPLFANAVMSLRLP
jgi:hypothetical protein